MNFKNFRQRYKDGKKNDIIKIYLNQKKFQNI